MNTWVLLSLLIAFVGCQANSTTRQPFIIGDNNPASVEYTEDTVYSCAHFLIHPGPNQNYDTSKMISTTCQSLKTRSKRFLNQFPVLKWIFGQHPGDIKEVPTMLKKSNASSTRRRNNKFLEDSTELRLTLLNGLPAKPHSFLRLLKWSGSEMTKFFGYESITQAWPAMAVKKLQCTSRNNAEIYACGRRNYGRKFGTRKSILSVGNFTELGTIYKYTNISEWAVAVGNEIISVDSCLDYGTFQECTVSRNNTCSVSNYEKCDQVAALTPNQLFVRNFDNGFVVVASNLKEHEFTIYGHNSTLHMVDSKHLFVKIPMNPKATELPKMRTINQDSELIEINNEDLNYLEALHGPHPEIIKHRILLKSKAPNGLQECFLWISVGVLVLAHVAVVLVWWITRRNENKQKESVVVFSEEQVCIE
ncbi:hypothetical protein GCK72_024048 [Caenorhabditis remanei]|nr:hypothetical protein GCK72_024048 [Caenorhabditis remanei]KAF1747583.1 hypothetical protein GCK72_024048 [Caenorhabditis remanei]